MCFNLKRDASPVATACIDCAGKVIGVFQSQARCQPRGDKRGYDWKRKGIDMFQSQARCQPRGDVEKALSCLCLLWCFNLKRDASPVATLEIGTLNLMVNVFQS